MGPGEELRKIRTRLAISTREVAELSKKIAARERDSAFLISNSWLTQIETQTTALPSIHKLFTLACIYHVSYAQMLVLFGVDLQRIAVYQAQMPVGKTHLIHLEPSAEQRAIELPIRFDPGLSLSKTNLLSRMIEAWGQVPHELLGRLDLRHRLYGFIGLQDYTLYPLLRPGSFVQIDPEVRKPETESFQSEFDRPIYFVELRNEYACSWCEMLDGKLLLVPHPLSPTKHRLFASPNEAEIIGQVVGVAMRIAGLADELAGLPSELSARP